MSEIAEITAYSTHDDGKARPGLALQLALARLKPPGHTLATATLVCLVLSACETLQSEDPFTGEKQVSSYPASDFATLFRYLPQN